MRTRWRGAEAEPRGYARSMKETVERELKLTPGEGFVLPELGGEPQPTRVFISTYHDTDDLLLARHGVTLRYRVEEGTGLWQLKLPRGAARSELEQSGPPARPPLELSSLLVAFLRGRELRPVARLRTRRQVVLADGAEIVDDSVAVLDGQRVTRRFRELEVELVGGDERTLQRLRDELQQAGAAPGELRPKLYRALDLDVPSGVVDVRRGDSAAHRARAGAGRAGATAPAPRPWRSARLRPRGSAPAPCRDPAPARIPPRRARAARPVVVGAATRRGRLAREGARPREGPRRPDRPARDGRRRAGRGRGGRIRPAPHAGRRAWRGARRRRRGALERPVPRPARSSRARLGARARRR